MKPGFQHGQKAWPRLFQGFRLVPLVCRARMEAAGKSGGFGSLEVSGWDHTPPALSSSAHPPFLRLLVPSFCLWALGFPAEMFFLKTGCNRTLNPALEALWELLG